jgi:protein gp37
MGENSKIQWTHHTFNPWWGCVKVSPGCQHCYAETFSKRTGHKVWGVDAPRRFFGPKHWREPLDWQAEADAMGETRRVFCASMADVFEDRPDLVADRERLFGLMHLTPMLDWLLLTKRPENVIRLVPDSGMPDNAWIGTTVENQQQAELRIPHLLAIPAAVHFLSVEPMLGPIDLSGVKFRYGVFDVLSGFGTVTRGAVGQSVPNATCPRVDWVICGGESGAGARPMAEEWARSLKEQCAYAGVPFFMKQMGGVRNKRGELEDLPEDLRVREFPKADE